MLSISKIDIEKSLIHPHTQAQTHTHTHTQKNTHTHTGAPTSPRPRHSRPDHIPLDGPAFAISHKLVSAVMCSTISPIASLRFLKNCERIRLPLVALAARPHQNSLVALPPRDTTSRNYAHLYALLHNAAAQLSCRNRKNETARS